MLLLIKYPIAQFGDFMKLSILKAKSTDELTRNTLLFTFEGAIGAIILNLANPFFSMFARRMGAGDYQIGLISSLPALVSILALIPGSLIVDKGINKKRIVSTLILLFGIMYPLAAITPTLGSYSVPIYITIIALMNWPFSVFNISWQSFFSDVMASRFTSAFTKRTRAATFLGTTTALAAGLLLAYIPKDNNQRILIYQLFFCFAFFLALLQSWILHKITVPETSFHIKEHRPSMLVLKECLSNLISIKEFRNFVLLSFIFHLSWHMAWPLFFIYQVDVIGVNEAWLSYVNVALGFAGVLSYSFWGKAIEKKGSRLILIVGTLGLAVNALTIIFVKTPFILLIQSTVTGLTYSAFTLAIFENLVEVVPMKNKTINIAMYTTLISLSQLISPMFGVWLYKQTSIVYALAFIGLFRLTATLLFIIRYLRGRKSAHSLR